MGNYDTGRKTDFECFIQDAELLNSIPTRPCHVIYLHGEKVALPRGNSFGFNSSVALDILNIKLAKSEKNKEHKF